MTILREIRDKDAGGKDLEKQKEDYKIRTAVRAIIFDEKRNIALMSTPKSQHGHYKIPGGGLEGDETIEDCLIREIKEEVGCKIEITQEVGEIIEYKNGYNQKQTSHCYLAKVKGKKGKPQFTKEEKEAEYEVLWVPIAEAIRLIKEDKTEDYTGKFILLRDYTFLIEAKKIKDSSH